MKFLTLVLCFLSTLICFGVGQTPTCPPGVFTPSGTTTPTLDCDASIPYVYTPIYGYFTYMNQAALDFYYTVFKNGGVGTPGVTDYNAMQPRVLFSMSECLTEGYPNTVVNQTGDFIINYNNVWEMVCWANELGGSSPYNRLLEVDCYYYNWQGILALFSKFPLQPLPSQPTTQSQCQSLDTLTTTLGGSGLFIKVAYNTLATDNENNAVFYTCVQNGGGGSSPILILVSRTPQANNDAFVSQAQTLAQTLGFSPLIPLNYTSAVNLNAPVLEVLPWYSAPLNVGITCGQP